MCSTPLPSDRPDPPPARRPDLRIELTTDARVIAAVLLWSAACVAALWRAQLPALVLLAASTLLLAGALSVLASQRFGGRGCPAVLRWSGSGRWECELTDGSREELELSPESRVFPGGALLVFRHARALKWLLLVHSGPDGEAVRRLRARLDLGREAPGVPGSAPWPYNAPPRTI